MHGKCAQAIALEERISYVNGSATVSIPPDFPSGADGRTIYSFSEQWNTNSGLEAT
jgi:hypothetical protein